MVSCLREKIRAKSKITNKAPNAKRHWWDFPGDLVVKNLPSNAEDAGVTPDQGT